MAKNNFKTEVLKSKELVLVDFYADWCGPCRTMIPTLKELESSVKVVKINTDDDPDLAEEYHVGSIPMFIFFKDGKEVHREEGVVKKEVLEEAINRFKGD